LGGGDAAATVMVAADVADGELAAFRENRVVAVMGSFANAAGMWRGGDCQGQRREVPYEREEQQQSCGQAMHASCVNQNPEGEASIEQKSKRAQAKGGREPALSLSKGRPPHT